jgi:hypothetical protein
MSPLESGKSASPKSGTHAAVIGYPGVVGGVVATPSRFPSAYSEASGRTARSHPAPDSMRRVTVEDAVQVLRRQCIGQGLCALPIGDPDKGVVSHGKVETGGGQLARKPAVAIAVEVQAKRAPQPALAKAGVGSRATAGSCRTPPSPRSHAPGPDATRAPPEPWPPHLPCGI